MANKKLKEQEKMQKRVADHQELLSAWMSNRMEMNKQILALSGLAIGLLVTFRSDVSKIDNDVFSYFWLAAGILFGFSIAVALLIFRMNSTYIELIRNKIKNADDNKAVDEEKEKKLERIDSCLKRATPFAAGLFLSGVVLTYGLAMYIVFIAS